ncbi:glycosyl transferase family 90 [Flavicella sp.]|uniref:glycosyl transferase family 90 n=1 Tax=Flavicella sp. TaxID=2957742 RepID=UPI00301A320D
MDKLIDIFSGYKKIKLFYYLRTNFFHFLPIRYNKWYKKHLIKKFSSAEEIEYILKRVNYYNKLQPDTELDLATKSIKQFKKNHRKTTYYFDTIEYLKYFNKKLKINTLFGDITHSPNTSSIVKSRPVKNNKNSIVLNLNKIRHFLFIKDKNKFLNKKNILIGRGVVKKQKGLRLRFLDTHFSNPLCDIGHTNDFKDNKWKVGFVPVYEQLKYKFILCWEGNDVATNLKYVMSSNSLAVLTKPKYETWFMEGTLIAGIHYVEIKDDFSDLNEKINYYSKNSKEAENIIKKANAYTKQFQNKKREDLISILVLEKYFKNTNQLLE